MAGVIAACIVYAFTLLDAFEQVDNDPDFIVEKIVPVPELNDDLLRQARDDTRQHRLLVEPEPLKHLLAKSIDVGPSVAAALQIPDEMVPIATLREHTDTWRSRWLWYEGKLTRLSGPRDGHPIENYSIYEATIELEDGNSVLTAFSVEAKEKLVVGDWVRAEGYFLKLRDTTYPSKLDQVPMLVGRTIERDYEDWPAITAIDPKVFENYDDSSFYPGTLPFRDIEEDQSEPLWHLGAFVRDTAKDRTFAQWRKVEPLTLAEPYERLLAGKIARGEPMRIFGTLIRRQTIAAPANPANIKFWTAVWIQVHGFGGHLIPIWVPKKVGELPMRAQLEVRGHYYRWFVYDAKAKRWRVPLFVAADLDMFELDTNNTMIEIGKWLGGLVLGLLIIAFVSQRRAARTSLEHSRDMDQRRRKRREQQAQLATAGGELANDGPDTTDPTNARRAP
tara:strand:+ start:331 stop:1674 length:1344 start_codon:yes stop_codon:yes gene_type:complete